MKLKLQDQYAMNAVYASCLPDADVRSTFFCVVSGFCVHCGTVCVCTHLHLTVAHCACVHHAMRCTPFTAGQVLFSPSVLSPG